MGGHNEITGILVRGIQEGQVGKGDVMREAEKLEDVTFLALKVVDGAMSQGL